MIFENSGLLRAERTLSAQLERRANLSESAATHRKNGEYTTIGRAALGYSGQTDDSGSVTGHSHTVEGALTTDLSYGSL